MRYPEYLIKKQYPSMRAFADVCGVCPCTMSHYISGVRFPNTHNFMTMANKLHVTAEQLYKYWYREVKTDD